MTMPKASLPIIMPLPSHDFDPTEAAILWQQITRAGYQIEFATPDGLPASGDPMMLSGQGLDPWGWIPGLRRLPLIGLLLRANRDARLAYTHMIADPRFLLPHKYEELHHAKFCGLLLPGGHASGMRPYLESPILQKFVADFFEEPVNNTLAGTLPASDSGNALQHKPIAAICHGVVLAARATSRATGKSVLYGKKTTALTWELEKSAWSLTRYFARFWDPNYYRTYVEEKGERAGYRSVEEEVKRALANESDFIQVPKTENDYWLKTTGLFRDTRDCDRAAWVVQDGTYLSARWPGDAHTLARKFIELLG